MNLHFEPKSQNALLRFGFVTSLAGISVISCLPAFTTPFSVPEKDRPNTSVVLNRRHFDLNRPEELSAFIDATKSLSDLSKFEKKEKKSEKKEEKTAGKSEEAVSAKREENKADTADSKKVAAKVARADDESENDDSVADTAIGKGRDWSSSKVRAGLKAMEHIGKQIKDKKVDRLEGIHQIQEIDWAVESSFVTPASWVSSFDPIETLFSFRDVFLNPIGRGNRSNPALNLATYQASDLSKIDPMNSTFWTRPGSISDKDLYTGYDRKSLPDYGEWMFTYESPHKGYGEHPSFEAEADGKKWKVKFGEEQSSGPFGCRIFWALGYPTEIVDFVPQVKVRWDPRILKDFNDRERLIMHLRLLGIQVTNLSTNKYFNPFDYMNYAVLKDGSKISPETFRHELFPTVHSKSGKPERNKKLYAKAFENKIDYLVMKSASITSKDKDDDDADLGFWDYNSNGHKDLREVRAMGILEAWMDNWDVRPGNNRLMLAKDDNGNYRLRHEVSDIGALFGNSGGMIRQVNGGVKVGLYQNAPNDFTWSFTHPQSPGLETTPIRDYMPVLKNSPFYWMNIDDARWMARLIGQLSERQIKEALIGAGYEDAEARLLEEKLVARRDEMVRDLGLSTEIAALRPNGPDKRLTYNPHKDGPVQAMRPSGQMVTARTDGDLNLVSGTLRKQRERRVENIAAK